MRPWISGRVFVNDGDMMEDCRLAFYFSGCECVENEKVWWVSRKWDQGANWENTTTPLVPPTLESDQFLDTLALTNTPRSLTAFIGRLRLRVPPTIAGITIQVEDVNRYESSHKSSRIIIQKVFDRSVTLWVGWLFSRQCAILHLGRLDWQIKRIPARELLLQEIECEVSDPFSFIFKASIGVLESPKNRPLRLLRYSQQRKDDQISKCSSPQ